MGLRPSYKPFKPVDNLSKTVDNRYSLWINRKKCVNANVNKPPDMGVLILTGEICPLAFFCGKAVENLPHFAHNFSTPPRGERILNTTEDNKNNHDVPPYIGAKSQKIAFIHFSTGPTINTTLYTI